MNNNHNARRTAAEWVVRRTGLPLIRRRCSNCKSTQCRSSGKFRINAHHKLLDIWLLALCVGCGETVKLTVMERVQVRAVGPATLDGLHGDDPGLVARLLADPGLHRRNRVTLDWAGAWALDAEPVEPAGVEPVEVSVRFLERIPLRPVRLLSEGLRLPRAEVERRIADGRISSPRRLAGRAAADFAFRVRP